MFFKKKTPTTIPTRNAPPPWENIDTSSVKHVSTGRSRFNLSGFISQVTGFGKWGTRFLLLGFAVSIGFVSYAIYFTEKQGQPPPPDINRPAMDKYATSSTRLTPNTHQ